jgi:hypothetical protein
MADPLHLIPSPSPRISTPLPSHPISSHPISSIPFFLILSHPISSHLISSQVSGPLGETLISAVSPVHTPSCPAMSTRSAFYDYIAEGTGNMATPTVRHRHPSTRHWIVDSGPCHRRDVPLLSSACLNVESWWSGPWTQPPPEPPPRLCLPLLRWRQHAKPRTAPCQPRRVRQLVRLDGLTLSALSSPLHSVDSSLS